MKERQMRLVNGVRCATVGLVSAIALVGCGGGGGGNALVQDGVKEEPPYVAPDFGTSVTIINPSMTTDQINTAIAPVTGNLPRQIFFMPGTYGSAAGQENPATASGIINTTLNANTAIAGLGAAPGEVLINGALHVENTGNPLGTFARTLGNLSINPIQPGMAPHTMRWLTSQTAHWRRVDLQGNVDLVGSPAAFAFGNMIANSKISGTLDVGNGQNTSAGSGGQTNAMYYIRDSQIGGWKGFASQMVFSGVSGAPVDNFGPGDSTRSNPGDKVTLATTPLTREAPFLYLVKGQYRVFVPAAKTNSAGTNWALTAATGTSMPISDFYIAQPSATADTLNYALSQGKNLILTPGTYSLDAPLQVKRANTVVMGLGFAQLNASSGTEAVTVADVPGVVLAGFSVGGGTTTSDVLIRIGTQGVKSGVASNPTTLSDVHVAGKAVTAEVINQDNVLVDGAWVRAGGSSAWADAAGSFGIVVNGDNVTWTGLWVEHFKKTQITWNGNGGRVVFLENEPPYTPPSQAQWMNGVKEGYPNLKVADTVTSFKLDGFGTYTRFSNGCYCFASSAIETPVNSNVTYHGITAGSIIFPVTGGGFTKGGFRHIFNDLGPTVDAGFDSGNSRLPYSDTYGFSSNLRIANFPN